MHSLKGWLVAALLLSACEDDNPVNKLPDAPIVLDVPQTCMPVVGPGTMHSTNIAAAETWTEAGSPHIVMFDTTLSAEVTIEPCAVVRIEGGRTVTIAAGGKIISEGTAVKQITFERLTAATAFGPIRAIGGSMRFAYTNFKGGGNPLGVIANGATLILQRSTAAAEGLFTDHVDIAASASQGIILAGVVGMDPGSDQLTIHGSAGFPIATHPNLVGTIPRGTYTGNATNEILITNQGQVTTYAGIHNYGVPYRVGTAANDQLDVAAVTGVATLAIDPGVIMKFQPGGRLRIDTTGGTTTPSRGALIAVGTVDAPIVFTSVSATPAAGDWLGIIFAGVTDPTTKMDYVSVEFAGGVTATGSNSCPYPGRVGQNDAAIRIYGTTAPATEYITNTTIVSSARDGIDRGWRDDPMTDFLATNTFTNVAGCKQSTPRTFAGVCPTTPPCP
jgi:hypothetical protein